MNLSNDVANDSNSTIIFLVPYLFLLVKKDEYIKNVNNIIEDGIRQMKYVETTDDTCNE